MERHRQWGYRRIDDRISRVIQCCLIIESGEQVIVWCSVAVVYPCTRQCRRSRCSYRPTQSAMIPVEVIRCTQRQRSLHSRHVEGSWLLSYGDQ